MEWSITDATMPAISRGSVFTTKCFHRISTMAKTGASSRAFEQAIALETAVDGQTVPNKDRKWPAKSFQLVTFRGWVFTVQGSNETLTLNSNTSASCIIRMLGCEFRLTGIRIQSPINSGGKLSLRLRGENQGVAPFYRMWPLAGGLLDMNGELVKTSDTRIDIRKWQPCNVDEALPGWRRSAR